MAMNYTEQGGEKTVIGGELEVPGTINITGTLKLDGATFDQAANQAASTASTVAGIVTDFNGLLTKLKAAGLMAADAAE